MNLHIVLGWLVVTVVGTVLSHPGDKPAPRYTINLDLPPKERWQKIFPEYKKELRTYLDWVDKELAPLKKFSDRLLNVTKMPQEYIDEIHGAVNSIGFNFSELYQMQFFYELQSAHSNKQPQACTSIIAENSNGTIMHVRNQDLSWPGLNKLTIDLDFQKGGKTIFFGTTFVGYIGVPTGMTANGYSVAAHTRFASHSQDECIAAAEKGGQVIGHQIRSILEANPDFSTGTKLLATKEFIVDCYLICAGAKHNEGKVITRNLDDAEDVWQLTDDRWFEVETNWDHWKIPLDGRRRFANTQMNKTTAQEVDLEYMYNIVSTPPDYAGDTVYTSKMVPSLGYYQSIIRGH